MAQPFASRLALLVFSASLLDAAWSATDVSGGLTTALVRMGIFYLVGLCCGGMAGWLMEELAQQDLEKWKALAADSSTSS